MMSPSLILAKATAISLLLPGAVLALTCVVAKKREAEHKARVQRNREESRKNEERRRKEREEREKQERELERQRQEEEEEGINQVHGNATPGEAPGKVTPNGDAEAAEDATAEE